MAQKNSTKKFASLLSLILASLLCLTLFFFTACNKETESTKEPTYTYTDVDDGTIANANFSYGQANTALTSFPNRSFSGWNIATDNSATSSKVDSGVINVSNEGWDNLIKKFYNDSELKDYIGFNINDYNEQVEGLTATQKSEKYLEFFKEKFNTKFSNPSKSDASTKENNVLMINNYLDKVNSSASEKVTYKGTAQKVTSSSKVTLEAGKLYELSVWVKTDNLAGNIPNDENYGANIRLINTFNGQTQGDFRISNIKDTEWTKYTIYVQADKEYECTFTLVLGLGYGNGSNNSLYYTEGTAYFDNISFKEVNEVDSTITYTTSSLDYTSEEVVENKIATKNTNTAFKYDMSVSDSNAFIANFTKGSFLTDNEHAFPTVSSTGTGGNGDAEYNVEISKDASEILTATVKEGSYTLKFDNNGSNFEVAPKSYYYYTFSIKTDNLENNPLGTADTTVFIHDVNGIYDIKSTNVLINDTNGEWQKFSIIVNNNFDTVREFYLEVVIGPTDISKVAHLYEYACGKVSFTTPQTYTNTIPENAEDDKFYSLISSKADKNIALYAGFSSADAYEDEVSSETYNFTPSNAQFGSIIFEPTVVDGYKGVVSNHQFIKNDKNAEAKINTRSGKGDNGNYAGLINTKYLFDTNSQYDANLKNKIAQALGYVEGDKEFTHIQPLMIYNANQDDNYGFISTSKNIAKSSYAKVNVSLKVTNGATAYVYLVDTSSIDKSVMNFVDFTVNTTAGEVNNNNKTVDGNALQFALKVSEKSATNDNGWVDVEFYIATGAEEKNFRVEVWNGDRNGKDKSTGFVFIENINITTTDAFTEPSRLADAHNLDGIFKNHEFTSSDQLFAYTRELTELEKKFNSESENVDKVSYNPTYVWAKYETTIYASFNTLEPVIVDPYETDEEEDEGTGCTAKTDPSTFWLSFSSILLAGALVAALIALIVKRTILKRKRNASDAKSHYKVSSRIKSKKDINSKKETIVENKAEEIPEEIIEEQPEKAEEDTNKEQTLDEYVYGDVQNFGEEDKKDE